MRIKKREVLNLFSLWNSALQQGFLISEQTGHTSQEASRPVVDLYSSDAILLPTVKYKFCNNKKDISWYFNHFVQKAPVGKILKDNIETTENFAVHSGDYLFTLTDKDTKKKTPVTCDFTFISKKQPNGFLKIIHHHSSTKDHAAESETLDIWAKAIGKNIASNGGSSYRQAMAGAYTDPNLVARLDKTNGQIKLNESDVRLLEKGMVLHCGRLTLTEEKDGNMVELKHRFTLVFDKSGNLIVKQLSKNPESADGIKVEPAQARKTTHKIGAEALTR